MSESNSDKKQFPIWIIIVIAVLFVGSLWYANYYYLVDNIDRGTLGDMFGTVNSLFSGLAFAGIIITIFLQSRELILQRKELENTREEFHIQNATMRLQRFENTFFNMLSLHHDIVNNIDWEKEQPDSGGFVSKVVRAKMLERISYKGRDVFELHFSELREQLRQYETIGDIADNYKLEYIKHQNDFAHYFRNLYRIIKLIDTTQFTDDPESVEEFNEKYKYTSIVRAQLSTFELLWLFYNCLSKYGIKFKPLVEKYALLKNLRHDEVANKIHIDLFNKSAFSKENNLNFYKD